MNLAPRVLVLAGGLSHERDVSLRSGRRVAEALRDGGCTVVERDVDAGLIDLLSRACGSTWSGPCCTAPRERTAPSATSSTCSASLRRDRHRLPAAPPGTSPWPARWPGRPACRCRSRWPCPTGRSGSSGRRRCWPRSSDRLGLPLVVKPARGGSALGVSVVRAAAELPRAMVECFAYGDVALVERYIAGVEVAVERRGRPGRPAVATGGGDRAGRRLLRLRRAVHRRRDGVLLPRPPHRAPRRRPSPTPPWPRTVRSDCGTCPGRTSIVDAAGMPWFLEVNVAPGMTETSLLPQAVEAAGEDAAALYRALVERATGDRPPVPSPA